MRITRVLPILALFVLTGFLSCSKAEPRIVYGFIELVYYPGRENAEERFSFFILPEDDDGLENLSELYLYHDREGLRWLFTSDDWISYEEDGKTWIGSRNIAMHDAETQLPRGQYRALLINRGGESTERNFTFDSPETPPYEFPVLRINDGTYRIESRYPVNYFLCYDQQGNTVQTFKVDNLNGSIRDLRLLGSIRTLSLWAEDPAYHISAISEAVPIR